MPVPDPDDPSASEPAPVPTDPNATETNATAAKAASEQVGGAEGPGWLPAILAGGLLLLMAFFICCGVTTAYLWNQRGELAVRTLRGHTMPMVEQSQLAPAEKQTIIRQFEQVADQIEAGEMEDWQAAAIMGRLQRLPLNEWGELAAVEAMVIKSEAWTKEERDRAIQQLSRLRRAVATGEATQFDLADVLEPVRRQETGNEGPRLLADPSRQQIGEVVKRARLVADRLAIDDRRFPAQSLSGIIAEQIEAGFSTGEL